MGIHEKWRYLGEVLIICKICVFCVDARMCVIVLMWVCKCMCVFTSACISELFAEHGKRKHISVGMTLSTSIFVSNTIPH